MDIEQIKEIQKLRKEGKSYSEISILLGIDRHKVIYYSSFYSIDKYYEKLEYEKHVCDVIKQYTNLNQICKTLGKPSTNTNYAFIQKIINKYKIDTTHFTDTPLKREQKKVTKIEEVLVEHSTYKSGKLAKRLIKEGLKEHKCEKCGRSEWEGEKIPLELHHINGDHTDNRIENLKLLCPNCHALTDNYCGKNIKPKKIEIKTCLYCGEQFIKKATLNFCCREHYLEWRKKHNNPMETKCPTDKEVLLNDFRELKSFVQIGKKYGVSDKTIFKWCAKLGLPTHKKEIEALLLIA